MTEPVPAKPGAGRLVLLGIIAVVAVAVVIVIATAFGGPGRKVETGVVIAVQATRLDAVQGFTILTADGRTVEFRIVQLENAATFAPGHLGEHKANLVPVRVTYIDRDGAHEAVLIEDAP